MPAWAVLIVLLSRVAGQPSTPEQLDHWVQHYPFTTVQSLIYARDRFWLGSSSGIYSSPDGATWTKHLSTEGPSGGTIAFGNDRFVVSLGPDFFVSENGDTWTQSPVRLSPVAVPLAFGNGRFVAGTRFLHASADGFTWSPALSNAVTTATLTFAADHFFAFANAQELISRDGLAWELYRSSDANRIPGLAAVARGPDGNVGIQESGQFYHFRLTNEFQIVTNTYPSHFTDLIYAGEKFVAVGYESLSGGVTAVSPDGFAWSPVSRVPAWLDRVTFGSGRFLAAGFDNIVTSTDAVTWRNERVPTVRIWSLASNENLLLATGSSDPGPSNGLSESPGATFLMTSTNGLAWSRAESPITNTLCSVLFDGARFVGVGDHGRVAVSLDGQTWSEHSSGFDLRLQSLAFDRGIYLAAGLSTNSLASALLISADAINWRSSTNSPAQIFRGVAAGNDRFVAVATDFAQGGFALISADGAAWKTVPTIARFSSIAFGEGAFVAVGSDGAAGVSSDGEQWQILSLTNSALLNVSFQGGLFLATDGQALWTSRDGKVWQLRTIPHFVGSLRAFHFWKRNWYAAGDRGFLARSATVAPRFTTNFLPESPHLMRLRVEDDLNASIALEHSFDLETWVTVTNGAQTPFELEQSVSDAAGFFRALVKGE